MVKHSVFAVDTQTRHIVTLYVHCLACSMLNLVVHTVTALLAAVDTFLVCYLADRKEIRYDVTLCSKPHHLGRKVRSTVGLHAENREATVFNTLCNLESVA